MTKSLLEPILEGIQQTHFFNGRLLSGEDLAREQVAHRDARRRLGRAIGEGIAYGLQVVETLNVSSKESPVVTIRAGAAINRRGDVLELVNDAELSLIGGSTERPATPSAFKECEPPASSGFVVGDGAYVLVIGPTEGREGRAPTSGLGNVTATCNARYTVEGVRFRLVEIHLDQDVLDDAGRLRNRLAYQCFGTATAQLSPNPFPPAATPYGAIDKLRDDEKTLTDCDVPLAVIFWTKAGGIEFVDMWAVRRRLSAPSVAPAWDLVLGDRLDGEGEAMFLQFQDQIEDIVKNDPNPGAVEMKARFAFLPPMGLVPIGGARGFSAQRFFGAAWDDTFDLDAKALRPILRAVNTLIGVEAVDLSAPHLVQVFRVFDQLGGERLRGFEKQVEAGKMRSYALFLAIGTTVIPIQKPSERRERPVDFDLKR
jgi:hypothetical protein